MPRLILIPGLGANRLLFEPQRRQFDQDLFLPDWMSPMHTRVEGRKPVPDTLRDYSRRWSERWKETVLARPEVRREYWLGGVSMGGLIALEAAAYLADEGLPPRGVFLIASARTREALGSRLILGLRLLGRVPPAMWPRLRRWVGARVARREGLGELDTRLLHKTGDGIGFEHVRWSASAITSWSFTRADWQAIVARGVPIHQIHGDRDWGIPLQRGDADRVVPGGGHLINMTHAEAVNEYLASRMHDRSAGA